MEWNSEVCGYHIMQHMDEVDVVALRCWGSHSWQTTRERADAGHLVTLEPFCPECGEVGEPLPAEQARRLARAGAFLDAPVPVW